MLRYYLIRLNKDLIEARVVKTLPHQLKVLCKSHDFCFGHSGWPNIWLN